MSNYICRLVVLACLYHVLDHEIDFNQENTNSYTLL